MKRVTFAAALLLAVLLGLPGCAGPEDTTGAAPVTPTTPAATAQRLDEVVVLDVRTPEEFAQGHINGAINIDVNDPAFAQRAAGLDRAQTYVVHCSANVENGRSARALATMQTLGFSALQNLQGGYAAWVESGSEVVR